MTEYIIELEEVEPYPFEGTKEHCQTVIVRKSIKLNSRQEQKNLHRNITILLSLDHPNLINIARVLERRGKAYELDYEYIPENLFKSSKITDNVFLNFIKEKLTTITQYLTQQRIKLALKGQDMGLTAEGEPKLFLAHGFQIVEEDRKGQLGWDYQQQIQKLMEMYGTCRLSLKAPSQLSDYSQRLDKKLTKIEDKLNRRKRRRSKGSTSSACDHSLDKAKKNQLPEGIDGGSLKHSNGSNNSEKTRYSTIEMNQVTSKPKIHRASFNDFSTPPHKMNQNQQQNLKTRFDKALEKTQEAFKIYDKYFKRNRRF